MGPFSSLLITLTIITIAQGAKRIDDTTLVHLVTDQELKANEAARVAFDSQVYDNGHHFDTEERYITISKAAKYRLEGHASLAGAGSHMATAKIVKISNGQEESLAECHTDDPTVRGDRCKMQADGEFKADDKVFLQVEAKKDAKLTNVDTYLFLAEKHKDK